MGLGDAPDDGVVGGLLALLHLAELHVGVVGRLGDGILEAVGVHEVGAAARGQVAAAGQQAQGLVVDLAVTAGGGGHVLAALGEGRRVQNNEVEGAALLGAAALVGDEGVQVLEDVGAGEAHDVLEAVQTGIGGGQVARRLRYVHAAHKSRPSRRGVETERAHMGEAVEHAAAGRDVADRAAVVLLVEEEARLLGVHEVKGVSDAVLARHHGGLAGVAGTGLGPPAGDRKSVV